MKRRAPRSLSLSLAGIALSLGLAGCGSAGVEEGMPSGEVKPFVPNTPVSTDMGGRAFSDQRKSQAKAAAAKQADAAAAPVEKTE